MANLYIEVQELFGEEFEVIDTYTRGKSRIYKVLHKKCGRTFERRSDKIRLGRLHCEPCRIDEVEKNKIKNEEIKKTKREERYIEKIERQKKKREGKERDKEQVIKYYVDGIKVPKSVKDKCDEFNGEYIVKDYNPITQKLVLVHKGCDEEFTLHRKSFLKRENVLCDKCSGMGRSGQTKNSSERVIEEKYKDIFVYNGVTDVASQYRIGCLVCGEEFKAYRKTILDGLRCPSCNDNIKKTSSKLEAYTWYVIRTLFNEGEYEFDKIYDIEVEGNIRKLRPDVLLHIKENKYHIEVNGKQHYEECGLYGDNLEDRIKTDIAKYRYFNDLGYKGIIIDTNSLFLSESKEVDNVIRGILEENNIEINNIDDIFNDCFKKILMNKGSYNDLIISENKEGIIYMFLSGESIEKISRKYDISIKVLTKNINSWGYNKASRKKYAFEILNSKYKHIFNNVLSCRDISNITCISINYIRMYIKEYGIDKYGGELINNIECMINEGMSYIDIGNKLNISPDKARYIADKFNVSVRKSKKVDIGLLKEMRYNRYSIDEISIKTGIGKTKLSMLFKEYDIPKRKVS